ncbi:hypothetical protein AMTRI_Chr05g59410 [Amborella trichopoda]
MADSEECVFSIEGPSEGSDSFRRTCTKISGAIGVWSIVYMNWNGESMVLGDTPWPEFRSVVQKIVLYSTEELIRMMRETTMPLISGPRQ